nr:immunoglobulin light chain junction region [Macaca mulatta]
DYYCQFSDITLNVLF